MITSFDISVIVCACYRDRSDQITSPPSHPRLIRCLTLEALSDHCYAVWTLLSSGVHTGQSHTANSVPCVLILSPNCTHCCYSSSSLATTHYFNPAAKPKNCTSPFCVSG